MIEGKRCAFCKGKAGAPSSDLGTLLGPLASEGGREDDVFVHRLCALWSPEVPTLPATSAAMLAAHPFRLVVQLPYPLAPACDIASRFASGSLAGKEIGMVTATDAQVKGLYCCCGCISCSV
jgi:hypothetical protein